MIFVFVRCVCDRSKRKVHGIVEHTMTMSSRRRADTPTKASLLATASIALLLAIVAAPAARAFHSPLSPAGSSSSATAVAAAPFRRRFSERRRQRGGGDGIAAVAYPQIEYEIAAVRGLYTYSRYKTSACVRAQSVRSQKVGEKSRYRRTHHDHEQ